MKILKKISVVYVLQVFAVILLFGYAVASPVKKTKEAETEVTMPLKLNKQSPFKTGDDSIPTVKMNGIWNVNTVIGW